MRILLPGKIVFKIGPIRRDKEDQFTLIKEIINHEDVTIINLYAKKMFGHPISLKNNSVLTN